MRGEGPGCSAVPVLARESVECAVNLAHISKEMWVMADLSRGAPGVVGQRFGVADGGRARGRHVVRDEEIGTSDGVEGDVASSS